MMKQILVWLLVFSAQGFVAQIQATLDLKKFNSPKGPYVEAYLNVNASSVSYAPDSNNIDKCKIEVLEIIKKGEQIVDYKKIVLENSTDNNEAIYADLVNQQRFLLEEGLYTFEIELRDLISDSTGNVVTHTEDLSLFFSKNEITISDIEFLDSFWKSDENTATSKSGYEMIPLVSDYFAPSFDKIAFYFEIYNADSILGPEGKYVLQYYIEAYEDGRIVGDNNKISKQNAKEITPIIHAFDIFKLPTGNYYLTVQIKDQNNYVIAEKKQRFQRLNMMTDVDVNSLNDLSIEGSFVEDLNADSLNEFIYCLRPISSIIEYTIIDNQIKTMPDSTKKRYFYSFWYSRDPEAPGRGWEKYKQHVKDAEAMFSTPVKAGYETDRGRIYLKYGAPNSVQDKPNEPNSYPYQIWHFYKIGQYNNIRFVFYMPDLVTNDYELLHSNMRGEINNYRWQRDLQKRNQPNGNIDDTDPDNSWGTNTNTLFKNP